MMVGKILSHNDRGEIVMIVGKILRHDGQGKFSGMMDGCKFPVMIVGKFSVIVDWGNT